MSALLALLIIGGAAWFIVAKAGFRPGSVREPIDSVSEFSRAMTALDPTAAPLRRQVAMSRPAPRGPRQLRPPGTMRPVSHRR